ncbi:peptidoglycan-binding protein LysM [Ottowia sp.]|uniref:peptidoglycan-binding protein LysM n=1 Tax=Ottowia sp. TaxID=1898956 RepID=UPI002B8E72A1|nr:peptidoglycan-binding protein LysM [Ottowia sp.]HOB67429.1 peptidoglycan-binding protein LysM [Ottowia sp.]HPZ58211.1 peptidoglycan-binding protein LysM [Ottowia sp.]HQD48463.1 peptidoglycan-binding protein LysM [Ottowia sp.]
MGLFSFIKEAGEKLFGAKEVEQAAASNAPNVAELNKQAGDAIKTYIEKQNLGLSGLDVAFDGASGAVTLGGTAPSQEAAEKAGLAAGNVAAVSSVNNNLQYPAGTASQYHDVVSGDTLSAIAKKYYGDANKYNTIFEANKPMLSDPNKIYPGQKLRIPAL